MRKFHFLLLLLLVGFAVSCKTTKTAVSLREKSETISLRSDRLHSFLSADSISQWLSLSYDSLVILFDEDKPLVNSSTCQLVNFPHAEQSMPSSDAPASDDVYFFSNNKPPAVSPQPSAHADGAATAHPKPTAQPKPKALKVYGLHVEQKSNKQSIEQSSLTDSNVGSMQSSHRKEDNKTKSSPSSAPKYVFYILIMAAAIFFLYRLRRH